MKKIYDIVYLTNTPSFYKLNLMERVAAAGVSVLMVFAGYDSRAVNTPDVEGRGFDVAFLHRGEIVGRGTFRTYMRLCALMRRVEARHLLYSGWFMPEYNLYALTHGSRSRNAMVMESTLPDCRLSTARRGVKRHIVTLMSTMLVPGTPHRELADALHFDGRCITTGGVGIIDTEYHPTTKSNATEPLRYLYVGRLSHEKNLAFLVEAFNKLGLPLTIVGDGPGKNELQSMARDNIRIEGFVDNRKLHDVYAAHDVLVLPSLREPWGIVVDEALYHGLPVVASRAVGAAADLVESTRAGVVFDPLDKQSLYTAIDIVNRNYRRFAEAAAAIDFEKRFKNQVDSYVTLAKGQSH